MGKEQFMGKEQLSDQIHSPGDVADSLLSRFLMATDQSTAEAALAKLLTDHADPLIRKVVGRKLHFSLPFGKFQEAQEEEDIRSTILLKLILHLHQLRASGLHAHIEDFAAYIGASASNTCNEVLRSKYPLRWRLKNRIRYLLKHRNKFELCQDQNRDWLCGLTGMPGAPAQNGNGAANFGSGLDEFLSSIAQKRKIDQMALEDLIDEFLRWVGKPMPLDDLVGVVAELQGVSDRPVDGWQRSDEDTAAVELLPDLSVDVAHQVETRFYLQELWKQICDLPEKQRIALLLNLRDSKNRDALILFTLTGIAKSGDMADLLGMSLEQFGGLWKKLPIDDHAIGEMLGISRQQVINLRKSARARLVRRMASRWEAGMRE